MVLACGSGVAADSAIGWRGDGSGKFPDADPPVTWGRVSKAIKGLHVQARKPEGTGPAGKPMLDGVIRDWLILGPVPVPDVPKAHEKDTLPNETQLSPDDGEKIENLAWKRFEAPEGKSGATMDFTELLGANPKSFVFAHSYIYSDADSELSLQLTHRLATRVVLNGKQLYAANTTGGARINLKLTKGWNRFLLKVSSEEKQWFAVPLFHAHVPNGYDETNIAWTRPLPGTRIYQGTPAGPGGPIVVGGKIFVQCEPHDLFCIDKEDGKVLWVRSNSYFDALTDAEKDANPAFKEIEPLAAKWNEMNAEYLSGHELKTPAGDREKLEKSLYDSMQKIDGVRFKRPVSQDVGYAGLTPTSDGKFIYSWFASGVTACYDLDGNRKWIRIDNHETVEHGYTSSPILVGDKLIVFMRDVMAFDTKTGKEFWRNPFVEMTGMNPGRFFHGSFTRARIGDVDTVISANGSIIRASDGKVLFDDKRLVFKQAASTPVIDKGILCIMTTGGDMLYTLRLPESVGDTAVPEFLKEVKVPTDVFPFYYLGWHLASPIVHDGLIYVMNNAGVLTVVDEKEGTIVYRKLLDLDHFETANEGPVRGHGVSPVLAGKHLYFFGNSGAAVVLEPGREFKQVAKNKIEGLAAQGSWGERQDRVVASPFVDGKRIYYRTETVLYALGSK